MLSGLVRATDIDVRPSGFSKSLDTLECVELVRHLIDLDRMRVRRHFRLLLSEHRRSRYHVAVDVEVAYRAPVTPLLAKSGLRYLTGVVLPLQLTGMASFTDLSVHNL